MRSEPTAVVVAGNHCDSQNDTADSTARAVSSGSLNLDACAVQAPAATPERRRRGPVPRPEAERFWSHVRKTDGCWLWTGGLFTHGRGAFNKMVGVRRKVVSAHRVSWEMSNGPIPNGLCICHRCDTPACVRPDHLFLGTDADNMRDMRAKGRWGNARPVVAPRAWFSVADADALRDIIRDGERPSDLARIFGLRTDTLIQVVDHGLWVSP